MLYRDGVHESSHLLERSSIVRTCPYMSIFFMGFEHGFFGDILAFSTASTAAAESDTPVVLVMHMRI